MGINGSMDKYFIINKNKFNNIDKYFIINKNKFNNIDKYKAAYYLNFKINLNFKRNRLFISLVYMLPFFLKNVIFNSSLGIISKFFSNKKNFLKSKSSYIFLITFFKKIMLWLKIGNSKMFLNIKGRPKYLFDLL